jgi:SlyX protein
MSIEEYEQQVIELQAKVAYQEDMLQSLSTTIADQDKMIHLLEAKMKRWESRLDEMTYAMDSDSAPISEPPPPHY